MQLWSKKELAKRADISTRTLDREIARGKGPAVVHISERRIAFIDEDGERWIRSRRRAAPGQELPSTTTAIAPPGQEVHPIRACASNPPLVATGEEPRRTPRVRRARAKAPR